MLKKVKTKKQFFVEKFGTIISFITDFSLSQQEDIFKVFGWKIIIFYAQEWFF